MDQPEEARTPTELAEKYHRWACSKAITYWRRIKRTVELTELFSAARLGLWRAALKYDHSRGIPFCGHAQHWIRSELNEAARLSMPYGYRRASRYGEIGRADRPKIGVLAERPLRQIRAKTPTPEAELIAAEFAARLPGIWDRIRPLLGATDYDLLIARFRDGEGYEAIADRYGVRKQRVNQLVHRALEVLRQFPELADG